MAHLGQSIAMKAGRSSGARSEALCQRLGNRVAVLLRKKLPRRGRSLYVGAGVAELPALIMETAERGRAVEPYNLRRTEVAVLNRACRSIPLTFHAVDAARAKGRFDHLWMVSVLNDPERFPSSLASVLWAKQSAHPGSREVRSRASHCARAGCLLYGKAGEARPRHNYDRRSSMDCRVVPSASSSLSGWDTLLSNGISGRSDLFYPNWQGIKSSGYVANNLELETGLGFR